MTAEERVSALALLAGHNFHEAGPVERGDALAHLRRPFSPAAVRWKVQTAGSGYGIVVAYLDARLVVERLNLVAGLDWSDAYRTMGTGVEECALTVHGVTRHDVGKAQGFEAEKAARSDALKRAGVRFGVGVSVYALKSVLLNAQAGKTPDAERLLTGNKQNEKTKKWSATISRLAEDWLSEMYGRWLAERGEELFGPALDHGDELGAQGLEGDETAPPAQEAVEEPVAGSAGGAQVEGERADELRARAAELYAEIRAMNAGQIPPAKHKADLRRVGGSVETLFNYVSRLEEIRDQMKEARS